MKAISIILLLLAFATHSWGQSFGFPVIVTNSNVAESQEMLFSKMGNLTQARLITTTGTTISLSTSAVAANTDYLFALEGNASIQPGFRPWVKSIVFSSNRGVKVRPQLKPFGAAVRPDATYGIAEGDGEEFIAKNGQLVIPYGGFLQHSTLNLKVIKATDYSDTTKLEITAKVNWVNMANTPDMYSPNQLLVIGTSVERGTGATAGLGGIQTAYVQQLVQWLQKKTKSSWGVVDKSISGGTSTMALNAMNFGWQRLNNVKVIVVGTFPTNDVGSGISYTTSAANYTAKLTKLREWYPNALILVQSPIPSGISANESALATWRSNMPGLIAGLNDNNIKFIPNTGTMWLPSESGTYTTDNTHPNVAGNIREFNAHVSYLTDNNISIPFVKTY